MLTQAEISRTLPAEVDAELSWTESELPERERTKHVHRLHPYLGKFVPQLVEVFLQRHFAAGQTVLDPFAGSGTTLVEASCAGMNAVGVDISAFNCLLTSAKTTPVGESGSLSQTLARAEAAEPVATTTQSAYLERWYEPRAREELLRYRTAIDDGPTRDLQRIVLSRAARSARRTAHHDLDFPREPVLGPYECRKHSRICTPTAEAFKFLRRYTSDTGRRVAQYSALRAPVTVTVLHADARTATLPKADGVITSPPYPGRIDYHAQHQYAYELLELEDRRTDEIGTAEAGTTKAAIGRYVDDMSAVFQNAARSMPAGAPVVIVVDDSRELYGTILERSGLRLVDRRLRHVNRRTGRRQGEFYESILVCKTS
jgi:hypothetical protein